MKYEKIVLNEIASVQTGPFGSQLHKKDYVEVGTPIITVEHLGDNKITYQNLPKVSESDVKRLSKYTLKTNDIVFSRVGSVDRRAIVTKNENGWLFSGRCLRIRVHDESVNPVYLSYYFGLSRFKEYIRNIAVGATMPSLNTKILSNIEVELPNKITQDEVARFLNLIDTKIWLNEKIILKLEELAQTLFKHWFVDFEFPNEEGKPYKSSGGKMVESELGMIPEGWSVDNFEKIITIGSGKRPKSKVDIQDENNQIPIIGSSKVMGFTETELFDESIIVIGRVGTHGVVQRLNVPCWPSDNTFVLRSKYEEFMYHKLKTIDYKSMNRGSTQPLLTQKDIKNVKVILPSNELLMEFEDTQKKFSSKISQLKEENTKLENLRDTLLPKLLSGELELPDDMEVTDDVPIS